MSAQRDHLFPATSIGRSGGAMFRSSSTESLTTAHPLLAPQPSSPSSTAVDTATGQRYVPYTPRQRNATQPATSTGTMATSGDATSKLQLMHLKSAAQGIGLDSGSVGWIILEKLAEGGEEWTEIWNTITANKATLLLPTEPLPANENITPEFVKDHVVLCEGPNRQDAPIVTLSGLRGILQGENLTLQSSIHPTSKLYLGILSPVSRATTLASLAPLPKPSSSAHPYPTYTVPSHTTNLPIPPRPKPSLPPRPTTAQGSSRLANPFASLFGGSGHKTSPSTSSINSVASTEDAGPKGDPTLVSAFTISRRIVFDDVCREVVRTIKSSVADSLTTDEDTPRWLLNRMQVFAEAFHPFIKAPQKHISREYVVHNIVLGIDAVTDLMQEFYYGIEEEVALVVKKAREEEQKEKEELAEVQVQRWTALVEDTMCRLFYDRLLHPAPADDLDHDEALSSRIAALNMLDLTLAHLDIIFNGNEDERKELDAVIKTCGESLTQLNRKHTPAEKAALFVECHKVLVDGLSQLPPIRLKSEDDPKEIGQDSKVSVPTIVEPEKDVPDEKTPTIPQDKTPTIQDKTPTMDTHEGEKVSSPVSDISQPVPDASREKGTAISLDVLFPLLIFSVVRSNPPHLVSHVLFTQRLRNKYSGGGEEAYCVVNIMAVVEFLENVDLAALGLGAGVGGNTKDLTPIPVPATPAAVVRSGAGVASVQSVRDRVDTLIGVVDSVSSTSFGMLKSLLPSQQAEAVKQSTPDRPGFGILRRDSVFSIRSILPGATKAGEGEEMADVSRPASRLSRAGSTYEGEEDAEEEEEEGGSEDEDEESDDQDAKSTRDVRSIRSFESMMKDTKKASKGRPRKSLTDRLSGITSSNKLSPTQQRSTIFGSPSIAPPNKRFMECAPEDLRIAEIAELLKDYRRIVEGVKGIGAFKES
ncbi:hypothetical protein CYLTODRAFT_441359 [Cylindrobasidium torrendii FP15055 ss-10]|uniref:VPS9 domain-containing protein n=1 Tax=Cylindrobasidium torrendii FP15055 ss-10 TaxID=1314674 RepID=A0A0D7BLE5_9AGAR|nr:hypothetical protein CYLTODRAFT_441359 [Cylindrobasidium torrendii FP15055 ss-10]